MNNQFESATNLGRVPEAQSPITDMQSHVQRTEEASKRLYRIHDSLLGLIGRLYGEGQINPEAMKGAAPRAAGLSSEMTGAISEIETAADRIDQAVTRLSSFA